MTVPVPLPGPENPEKGENLAVVGVVERFPPFPPFSGPGTAQNAAPASPAAALAAVRAYRRTPPPEPPRAPRRKQDATADRPRMHGGGDHFADYSENPSTTLAGVPPEWCEGVRLLASRPAPQTIPPRRWAALAATSTQMLRDHGAALHAARWDGISLFGLHPTAPATNPPGWGLAWLLGEHGEVLDVSPGVIGMRWGPDGAWLAFRRRASGRGGAVLAWLLA